FIPDSYLRASVDDRLSLLQGMMDADGGTYLRPEGGRWSNYSTSNLTLARNLCDLVGSLGGHASIRECKARGGNRSQEYVVTIQQRPDGMCPHRLERKVSLYRGAKPSRNRRRRHISEIESVGYRPVRCITVEHPEHLYITDDYIVTHNSSRVPVFERVQEI